MNLRKAVLCQRCVSHLDGWLLRPWHSAVACCPLGASRPLASHECCYPSTAGHIQSAFLVACREHGRGDGRECGYHLPILWNQGLVVGGMALALAISIGPVRDQAELFGLLLKIRNLNLTLLAVSLVETEI